jgi:hypothetical protein
MRPRRFSSPCGEDATNFKLTRWEAVAGAFAPPLRVDPFGWFPRLGG